MSARQSAACDEALRLVREGMSPYAASKMAGISLSTMYAALKRHNLPAKFPHGPRVPKPAP